MTDCVKRCLEVGINFFDTAELYGFGEAETLLGNSFKELNVKREELVVSTKLFYGAGETRSVGSQFGYY
jgi:aryl-alcohol dehydrogenase-like predicted oxidoreductase